MTQRQKSTDHEPEGEARTPARAGGAVRSLVALGGVVFSVTLAFASLRAGASRLMSDYAVRANDRAGAELAIQLAPKDPEGHYALAGLLADEGNFAGAVGAYERARELRPRDYVISLELGKVREQAGDAEGALADFREAVRLAPFYAQPRWQLGNALLRAGRREEAVAELARAAESDPSLYPNFVQAAWHVAGKDARRLVEAARPRSGAESLALARFLVANGEAEAAMRLSRESGAALSEEERAKLLADLLAAGRFAEAYEVWAEGGARGGGRGSVADAGFEGALRTDDAGFGWRFERGAKAVGLSLDAAEPREGGQSLRVEYAGEANPTSAAVSQLVLVEPGARYRLSFAARTKEIVTGGLPFLEVAAVGAKGETALASSQTLPAGAGGWQDYTIEFAVPKDVEAVRISLKRRACTTSPCPAFGNVWLDAFRLSKL